VKELDRFGPALVGAMVNVEDMVTVMDAGGNLEYINPYGVKLFGYENPDDLVGTSLVDLIHPDDLGRVMVAVSRMLDTEAEVPGRPAQVRIRRRDGSFIRIEANGAFGDDAGGGGARLVVIARPTVDADLHEHLMNVLTTGAPSEKSFELVPEFGLWRQPTLLHAVFVLDDDGVPLAFGSPSLLALGGLDDPDAPWAEPAGTGVELFDAADDLGDVARERAQALGVTWVRARPVHDTLHRTHAIVVMAHDHTSPLPAERSTLEFSWFAIDKMAAVLEMALAWRCQAVELRRAAATDPLTGLANRAGFWSRYHATSKSAASGTVSVLCIDLDRFKPVNDTYGHSVGDALLIDVSDRLRRILRPADIVARLGGDEFAVVVHDLDGREVGAIADRIVHELCQPFAISGHDIRIGASVGVAVAATDQFDPTTLLDAADDALYQAKNTGRNQWVRSDG
jgi:diguanylate cyclase (GGDEF)-like protein/PAS domain S-box-containing protein